MRVILRFLEETPLRFGSQRGCLRQKLAAICDCDFWCSRSVTLPILRLSVAFQQCQKAGRSKHVSPKYGLFIMLGVALHHLPCEISEARFFFGNFNGFPPHSHGLSVNFSCFHFSSVILNRFQSFSITLTWSKTQEFINIWKVKRGEATLTYPPDTKVFPMEKYSEIIMFAKLRFARVIP